MKTNGGALPGEYTLAQFHFHWGSSDHGGSEHTLEGEQFFSEVHLVHFKSEYGTIGNSVDKSDGLAVLGFFIEEDETAEVDYHEKWGNYAIKDTPLDNFFQNMVGQAVQDPKKTSEVQFSMSEILPSTLDNYYRYISSPLINEGIPLDNAEKV